MKRTRRRQFLRIENLATHPEENLAPEQLAAWWNVEIQTIRAWARKGAFECFRAGRALRIVRASALAFEQRNRLRAG